MDTDGYGRLADLASPRTRPPSGRALAAFLLAALIVVGGFAGLAGLMSRYETYQAESFGDRRLASPLAAECDIARLLLKDHHDRDLATLLRSVGAGGEKMELRAFAWRSSGVRTPGHGADWRKCPGLGPYVRKLGMARLNSGGQGPTLYISRAAMTAAGDQATVSETFNPPPTFHGADVDQGRVASEAAARWWIVSLRRAGPTGRWEIVRRIEAPAI